MPLTDADPEPWFQQPYFRELMDRHGWREPMTDEMRWSPPPDDDAEVPRWLA